MAYPRHDTGFALFASLTTLMASALSSAPASGAQEDPRTRLQAAAVAPPAPLLIKDIYTGTSSSILTQFDYTVMAVSQGILYFPANDGTTGVELWRSDGTAAGTWLVKDIYPGALASSPRALVDASGTLYFTANDGSRGREVWKSDGTLTNTVIVSDVRAGASTSDPSGLRAVGNTVFFIADDGVHDYELWATDGTIVGTRMVRDMSVGSVWPYIHQYELTPMNGLLFFTYYYDAYQRELWKSNGTTAGTEMLRFIREAAGLTPISETLYLAGRDTDALGMELWKSDGTVAGTTLVADIFTGYGNSSSPTRMTNVSGTLFFAADDGAHGIELWKSGGAPANTVLITDINPSGGGLDVACSIVQHTPCQAAIGGLFYFTADDGAHGVELWRSDGTVAGTFMVRDIWPGATGSRPVHLTPAKGKLYFSADDGSHGYELWVSDGTLTGTVLLGDINTSGPSSPSLLTPMGNWLYFVADDVARGKELWGVLVADLLYHAYLPLARR